MRDVAVAKVEKVLCRSARDSALVDADVPDAAHRAADHHQRVTHGEQLLALIRREVHADRDQRIRSLAQDGAVEDPLPVTATTGQVVQDHVVVGFAQGGVDALDHGGVKPTADRRCNQPHRQRAAGRETRRARRRNVAELIRNAADALPRGLRNIRKPTQGA